MDSDSRPATALDFLSAIRQCFLWKAVANAARRESYFIRELSPLGKARAPTSNVD